MIRVLSHAWHPNQKALLVSAGGTSSSTFTVEQQRVLHARLPAHDQTRTMTQNHNTTQAHRPRQACPCCQPTTTLQLKFSRASRSRARLQ
jgi:hypothetical protein